MLDAVLPYCGATVEKLNLKNCQVTNQMVKKMTQQIQERKEPVTLFNGCDVVVVV